MRDKKIVNVPRILLFNKYFFLVKQHYIIFLSKLMSDYRNTYYLKLLICSFNHFPIQFMIHNMKGKLIVETFLYHQHTTDSMVMNRLKINK